MIIIFFRGIVQPHFCNTGRNDYYSDGGKKITLDDAKSLNNLSLEVTSGELRQRIVEIVGEVIVQ